jgi:hypothetical protein
MTVEELKKWKLAMDAKKWEGMTRMDGWINPKMAKFIKISPDAMLSNWDHFVYT